jgi:hypothetical protein
MLRTRDRTTRAKPKTASGRPRSVHEIILH